MNTITLWHLSEWGFAALACAALLVGFSKTAVSGANTVSLAVFAAVLPARASTGALLPLLIAGDVLAVLTYRRHAHWPTLWRLFPAVAAGVVLGTLFLVWADDGVVRTSIGAILLVMAAVTVWRRRTAAGAGERSGTVATRAGRVKARSYGVLGGFTTMVANAGGPVMSMYLLSAGFRKLGFLGTSAFFFLVVNVSKVPFSVGLGLIDGRSLLLDAALVVFVVPGALLGKWAVLQRALPGVRHHRGDQEGRRLRPGRHRINQRLFERLVIAATVVGGAQLLLR
ncbi:MULTISPECIES: sulfite exporter TauE/SafE family protein [Streptomyces]|uniref:Probable membrane transporter protein n=1 Tax=Streptomyces flaveolus TaxID=67297 RepID=A0ABV3AQC7_9ACTN|nr:MULTISPECIES: sulfite exporter TauE/SafE family protein [Streptomyces]